MSIARRVPYVIALLHPYLPTQKGEGPGTLYAFGVDMRLGSGLGGPTICTITVAEARNGNTNGPFCNHHTCATGVM